MEHLTGTFIGWFIFMLIIGLVAFFLLIWLGRKVADRYFEWREAKTRASDDSGDNGGHPRPN